MDKFKNWWSNYKDKLVLKWTKIKEWYLKYLWKICVCGTSINNIKISKRFLLKSINKI